MLDKQVEEMDVIDEIKWVTERTRIYMNMINSIVTPGKRIKEQDISVEMAWDMVKMALEEENTVLR